MRRGGNPFAEKIPPIPFFKGFRLHGSRMKGIPPYGSGMPLFAEQRSMELRRRGGEKPVKGVPPAAGMSMGGGGFLPKKSPRDRSDSGAIGFGLAVSLRGRAGLRGPFPWPEPVLQERAAAWPAVPWPWDFQRGPQARERLRQRRARPVRKAARAIQKGPFPLPGLPEPGREPRA